jgi:hypothetical protein
MLLSLISNVFSSIKYKQINKKESVLEPGHFVGFDSNYGRGIKFMSAKFDSLHQCKYLKFRLSN